jgi:hypothetical protein
VTRFLKDATLQPVPVIAVTSRRIIMTNGHRTRSFARPVTVHLTPQGRKTAATLTGPDGAHQALLLTRRADVTALRDASTHQTPPGAGPRPPASTPPVGQPEAKTLYPADA